MQKKIIIKYIPDARYLLGAFCANASQTQCFHQSLKNFRVGFSRSRVRCCVSNKLPAVGHLICTPMLPSEYNGLPFMGRKADVLWVFLACLKVCH